ncbi:MAG TPA: methionine--tRNA ligase [Thermoclostridium sp.]|nr:methionine--tRNA ligase [Clostridiaceae bacterium]HOQ75069.1 methionine--tRNA ligase [Thermoclostridium sp.]HPU45828.1 methionine--tRNA ligase [Thermoclostridium sp.]
MKVLIGGAWPYANGSLHIGHLSSLIGGDVLARYHRLRGDTVCYVSGSDCHGTPITIKARKEGVHPSSIAEHYHSEFEDSFRRLGFTYDSYGKTSSPYHKAFVREFFLTLHKNGFLYEKDVEQVFCDRCNQFLPDRFVVGKCPECGKDAKGDQCDHCGSLLDPVQLEDRKCGICASEPDFRASTHLFIPLGRFEKDIRNYLDRAEYWRANAKGMTGRYLDEGLRDRAATRDIDWGIDVPIPGFEEKKIYVWLEAVLGYLSGCKQWCEKTGNSFEAFWDPESSDVRHYYVHGKDNITFHTVILPALLLAHGGLRLPDRIVSAEYETLEGRKISTSSNWAVWVPYLLERYQPDSIRYFFIANGPEKRDSDFSWQEFVSTHNADLVGQFGNLVNRTLVFIKKNYESSIPPGALADQTAAAIEEAFRLCGKHIEEGSFRDALQAAFSLVRFANKYFDDKKPWITIHETPVDCANTIFNLVQTIACLSVLLEPFVPFSCESARNMLGGIGKCRWEPVFIEPGRRLNEPVLLFQRLDKKAADEEVQRLKGIS